LFEKFDHQAMSSHGKFARGGGKEAVFQLSQLENIFMVCAVGFTRFFLAIACKSGGRSLVSWLAGKKGIRQGADSPYGADRVQFVGVK